MGALLALTSAVCYGIVVPQLSASLEPGGAPTAGGMLSRRAHFAAVTFIGRLGGLVLATAAALLVAAGAVRPTDLLWGVLSGVGSGAAMHFLNRGLSRGAMSTVVPVSAVTSVALSVLCGVLLLGDRPGALAWTGFAVTGPALWLVADDGGGPARSTLEADLRQDPPTVSATDCSPVPVSPCSTSRSARQARRAGCGRSRRAASPPYSCCRRSPPGTDGS